eukprot:CCRYP_016944-RA/>CCRYP_016944-RA protein AED:0.44 eAED:0.44 QI:0/0/0/1/0/0/3/0/153
MPGMYDGRVHHLRGILFGGGGDEGFVIKGDKKAVLHAVKQIEDSTTAIDVEVEVSADQTFQSYFLEEVKTSNYGIEFDLLARMNRIILHGPPDKVEQAKADLLNLCGISKSCGLDSKQVSLVVEKTGKTIHGLSQKHAIIMDVSKVGDAFTSV